MRDGHSWVGASAAQIAAAVQRGEASATEVIVDHLDHARVADRVLDLLGVLRDGAAAAEAEQVDAAEPAGSWLAGACRSDRGPVVVAEDTAGGRAWPPGRHAVARHDHESSGGCAAPARSCWARDASWRREPVAAGGTEPANTVPTAGTGRSGHPQPVAGRPDAGRRLGGLGGGGRGRRGPARARHQRRRDLGRELWAGWPHPGPRCRCDLHGSRAAWTTASSPPPSPTRRWVMPSWPGRGRSSLPRSRRLRVAASVRSPCRSSAPDRATQTAVRRAARLLIGLDHDVVATEPDYPTRLALRGAVAQRPAGSAR